MERRIKSQSIVATILFMAILASILFLFLTTEKNLVISCCDHVGNDIPITDKGHLLSLEPKVIGNWLNVFHVYTRNSEDSALIY
jgi:hypothetical protein